MASVTRLALGIRHWAFTLIAGLVLTATAGATVLIPADLSALTAESTAIVHGRVVDVRAEWLAGRRAIETYVTVAAATYLKGDLGETVTLRVPGGRMGAYRSRVVGAPIFNVGDEVVLFLGSRGPSVPYVLGLSQGVYRVRTDPESGRRTVIPPALVSPDVEPVRLVRGDPNRPAPTLERFAADVRALLARKTGAR
ncbi:MAG: hypothetical protein ACRD1S_14040 [Vicinamibacterales bacterium]